LPKKYKIAVFVSSHGYGHAARISAVLVSLSELEPNIFFEIFTEVPEWFFSDGIQKNTYQYHSLKTDVGLIQSSPLTEDIPATLNALSNFIPLPQKKLAHIRNEIQDLGCRAIICNISPLGIAVSNLARIPSILVENFTWDWIYKGYPEYAKEFNPFISYLNSIFNSVDFHIQAKPICNRFKGTNSVNPICRRIKNDKIRTRKLLHIPSDAKTILVTLGGVPTKHDYINKLKIQKDVYFILPIDVPKMEWQENCIILPHHSKFFHPDLVNASDAVIGKLGYSTLSEIYHAGIPYGYIKRNNFKESETLANFVNENMPGIGIEQEEFESGTWTEKIIELLDIQPISRKETNGAESAAQLVKEYIKYLT